MASCRGKVADAKAALLFHTIRSTPHMTPDDIRSLVAQYITDSLDAWERSYLTPAVNDDLRQSHGWQDALEAFAQDKVDEVTEGLRSFNHPVDSADVQEFLLRHGFLGLSDLDKRIVARELMKAERTIAQEMKRRVQGQYGDGRSLGTYRGGGSRAVAPLAGSGLATSTPSAAPVAAPSPTLSAAQAAYLKHFEHRAPGTLEAKRNVLKRFIELTGAERMVNSLVKADFIAYRETTRKIPANAAKKFPGLPLRAVIEKAKGLPESVMISKQTVNQDLTHLSHWMKWMIDEGIYTTSTTNPCEGLLYQGLESRSHETFSDVELLRIFDSREFKAQRTEEPARYWVPLILAYSGARREEVAALGTADVCEEDGILYLDLRPDEARGRRLKNKSSRRPVVIHSHLLKLGLMDYVEARRATGKAALFDSNGDAIGKWFHRLLKKLKVAGKKTLHGMRPTVVTKLYAAGVDGETRRALLGHSGQDIHETVYLHVPLRSLKDALEKLEYNGL
jgi:integrase